MKIAKLEIMNFRGLKHLSLQKLGKVNVFLGENNIGKTSILEAIFLLTGMSNPAIPVRMNIFRDKRNADISSLKYYFYNTDLQSLPIIVGIDENNIERSIQLSPKYGINETITHESDVPTPNLSMDMSFLSRIDINYKLGKKKYTGSLYMEKGEFVGKVDNHYNEVLKSVFVHSFVNEGDAMSSYSELVKRQQKEDIVKVMHMLNSHISSVEYLSDGIYLQYEGLTEMLPLSMSGDGTRRFFNIVALVADPTIDIVLIDEIESGLHYSAYQTLWESLIRYVKQRDVQLFITTHSMETLACLSQVYQKGHMLDNDDLQVFSLIADNKGNVDAYAASGMGLQGAIENNIEIR